MIDIDEKIASCHRLCMKIGAETGVRPQDIEDFAQDCMVRALRHKDTYDEKRGKITTWMGAVAWSQRGRRKAQAARFARWLGKVVSITAYTGLSEDNRNDCIADYRGVSHEDIIEGRDIEHYLNILNESTRSHIKRWVSGESQAEIASELGVTRQTVNQSIKRGLAAMRRALGVAS